MIYPDNRSIKLVCLALTLALSACDSSVEEPAGVKIRPVKTIMIGDPGVGGERRLPGRIESARRVELAFRVPGTLKELPIKEGDEVVAGAVIAKLDDADFKTAYDDRNAVYKRTSADYERAKELVKDGFISRVDYDKVEADYKSAEAALNQARLDLSYTTLRAPFSGNVAQRYVQNFEEVKAKQPVIALRDLNLLDVKFNVPESLVIRLNEAGVDNEATDVPVYAVFDAAPDKRYWLSYKEAATRADRATQTFEVTYTLPAPDELEVLPGMTTTVNVDLTRFLDSGRMFSVPVAAVVADPGMAPKVWIVNQDTMTVAAREVEVGMMQGNTIQVLSGLDGGERIVTAGAPFLVEGMKVRLLPDVEQATDNLPRDTVRTAPAEETDDRDQG
jgi:RND family efflux transporter MFP subunit